MRMPWMRGAVVAIALLSASAGAMPVEQVPTPRDGRWISDTTGTLSATTIQQVEALATQVDSRGQGQLGVAIVASTDGREPRRYATELFNRWGVGHASRDDGILLFIAVRDRKAEIIVGRGVDSPSTLAQTDRIMASAVVANFKRGDANAAVLQAAQELVNLLATLSLRQQARPSNVGDADPSQDARMVEPVLFYGPMPEEWYRPRPKPIVGPPPIAAAKYEPIDPPMDTGLLAGLSATGVGLLGVGGFVLRRWLRLRPRPCAHCGQLRVLLDENSDDAFLNQGQRTEEGVASVDYDVWQCSRCDDVVVESHGAFFTSYGRCGPCGYRTVSTSKQTLVQATYTHGGQVEVTRHCENCGHIDRFIRYTAQLVDTSSSSSDSSSSSFGGGSSSGSGSSGSW
jgi:uncharacterized protein